MKTKKILEDLPGHADEVGKLSLVSKGAWPLPSVIRSLSYVAPQCARAVLIEYRPLRKIP